jgi:G-patch domain
MKHSFHILLILVHTVTVSYVKAPHSFLHPPLLIAPMMSKPISISFGKPKVNPSTPSRASTPIPPARRPGFAADPEDDDEDDALPAHESVLGFSSDGAILSRPVQAKEERVIENKGNADWRTRGRPPKAASQPSHAHENGVEIGTVEREKASKEAGLQFAEGAKYTAATSTTTTRATPTPQGHRQNGASDPTQPGQLLKEEAEQTADQVALSALLYGNGDKSSSTVIEQSPSQTYTNTGDETLDFRHDVASRPDPATLDEYAAMPVEEFGMALVRGMGKKRRANGEIITIKNPNEPGHAEDKTKKAEKSLGRVTATGAGTGRDPNMGYLGIGAKAAKSVVGNGAGGEDGLGAWGKADMRKNKRGEGMYTPVMLRDRRTGELISERELEERRRAAKESAEKSERRDEVEQRLRRERNLRGGDGNSSSSSRDRDWNGHRRHGRDDETDRADRHYRDRINGFSRMMIEDGGGGSSSSSNRRRRRSREKPSSRHSPPPLLLPLLRRK